MFVQSQIVNTSRLQDVLSLWQELSFATDPQKRPQK